MPKNIHTPRDELICGKLDVLNKLICDFSNYNETVAFQMANLCSLIREDAERMEQALIRRKYEVAELKSNHS